MTSSDEKPPLPVLWVEDNETDVILFKRGLSKIHSLLPLQVISDGQKAWEYLNSSGSTSRPTRPSLIILDLKVPRKSGLEILKSLKESPDLRSIPVVVLTSSREMADIDAVYSAGADFYLVKIPDPVKSLELGKAIHAFWLALHSHPQDIGADPSLQLLRKLAERPSLDRESKTRSIPHR